MRYILISDIHGNLEALQAVLSFVSKLEPFQLYCLGDVVGYGANPKECLEILRNDSNLILAGNHDLAVAKVIPSKDFNPMAQAAVEWTRKALTDDDTSTLANLPLVYIDGDYCFAHSSPLNPMEFGYVRTLEDVADVLSSIGQRFCFVGHTHLPVLVRMDTNKGKLEIVHDKRIKIVDGFRYFVNVGSTGQPRDNNPDACVVIVDEEDESIEFLRVPYDISTCQSKILSEGLPSYLAERLILAR
ncbi:MAG: metallophosphoesterase family protein [bacterium]|nr:metallophosphoesterase family protein [bacterium]